MSCGVQPTTALVFTAEALLSCLLDFGRAPRLPLKHHLRGTQQPGDRQCEAAQREVRLNTAPPPVKSFKAFGTQFTHTTDSASTNQNGYFFHQACIGIFLHIMDKSKSN